MTGAVEGKIALVTGASRGLGAAIARRLSEEGATVVLSGRDEARLRKVATDLKGESHVIVADFGRAGEAQRLAEEASRGVGDVDILVNNAGIAQQQALRFVTEEALDAILMVNVKSAITLTNALSSGLIKRRGNVVNVSSGSARGGLPGTLAYSASKGAIESFTKNAAIDLGRFGVRVNAVAPGFIAAGLWDTAFAESRHGAELKAELGKAIVLEHKWGKAEDVANAVLFLASDQAAYITGHTLRVDGGIRG
jgi:3-oxoacyl-[acyl-carrier protein] reductase